METINRTSFEVESIPFKGPDGESFATIIVKGTFTVSPEGQVQEADEQLPIAYGDTPFEDQEGGSVQFEADIAPYKPRADIVVVGQAYAPAGQAVRGIDVSLRVGKLHRVLRVYGDRQWHLSSLMSTYATEPQLFTKMPLTYERAFGGIDREAGAFCRENPVGRGFFGKVNRKSVHEKPLPNIEDPRAIIQTPKNRPKPVGFGFFGRAWHPRASYLGTYDEQWRKTRSPDPPADFKYDFYNAAHPDLQLDGYLAGGEAVELINLTPGNSTWRFALPNLSLYCQVKKNYKILAAYLESQGADRTVVQDYISRKRHEDPLPLHADTLCLIPDERTFFVIWRGRTSVYDLTALEIETVQVA